MLPRCSSTSPAVLDVENQMDSVRRALTAGTQRGYRTMVFASRGFSEEEWSKFAARFSSAEIALKGRDALIESMYPRGEDVTNSEEEVERNASALGTCSIEDSLQEGVSETVEVLFPRGCNE